MTELIEFRPWPKIPRLNRDITVTEKIDGTNACVIITEDGRVAAQSRKRIITPDSDNFGFAQWVADRAGALTDVLGPGYHYGEWWGSGIQRGYGLTNGERRFSLFNTSRWTREQALEVDGMDVVPRLYVGPYYEFDQNHMLDHLRDFGSSAAHYYNPEGIVIYHHASREMYKVLLEGDDIPKGAAA